MPAFDFILAGRYRLLSPLGEGGMAAVYRGRDLRLNREVAIKILREELTRDPDFLARFEREAQFVAGLSHANIVPVYDVGEDQGSRFIVMEYIRGRTLKDMLDTGGPLPPERAVEIMVSVLDALRYAHANGIIHRDVKPHNILIMQDGSAKLADFGIAHLAEGSSTRTAAILGSAHYLSPEQARGEEATVASDIYACGIVLYEMLDGRPPFDGSNALAIAHQHLHAAPPPFAGGHAFIPPDIAAAVTRALAKRPEDRFPDTGAFAAALIAASPAADATALQPLDDGGLRGDATQQIAPLSGAHPLALPADEHPGLILRRSARKTVVLAVLCAVGLTAIGDVAQLSVGGHHLPAYPSAPYAAVPALVLAALILSWFHVRSWIYRMDGNAAVLQWGVLSHHRFGVPVRYITTLELKQSLIDRLLGVGTVELCARDQHGKERRLVLEDLPHPRESYDDLMHFLGRTLRTKGPALPPPAP